MQKVAALGLPPAHARAIVLVRYGPSVCPWVCSRRWPPPGGGFCFVLLRVSTDHYVAGAVWERRAGAWTCVRAAPILRWLVGLAPGEARRRLERAGARWEWVNERNKAS